MYTEFSTFTLPDAWQAYDDRRHEVDISRAQLVICLIDVQRRSNTAIGQCDYSGVKVDVFPATFTFEVLEVKTARTVTTLDIRSDETVDFSCPGIIEYQVDQGVEIAQDITPETLRARLRPLVMGPAQ
ncbi:hypothetical protein [Streptomyces sp. 6N223]|uniref:hypothetical protein n=1 Tax=Streptomyces sp. 6N223 TaxID=3457412 RepID=UPI003FD2924F